MRYLSAKTFIHLSLLLVFLLAGNFVISGGTEIVYISQNLGPSDLYIFTVGVDKYQDTTFGNLKAAKNDAVVLADEFEKRGTGKFANINKVVLYDETAKKADILREFDRLAREIKTNDIFIFNFAGKGGEKLNVKSGEFYLFPSDFLQKSYEETAISNSQLQTLFRKIRAAYKIVILDSCKSASGYDSAVDSFVEQDQKVAALNDENVLFIGADTESFERRETNHGSLTEIVLKAIKGEADFNSDGNISARELEAFVYKGGLDYSLLTKFDFHPRTVTRGKNFDVSFTDKKLEEIASEKAKKAAAQTVADSAKTVNQNKVSATVITATNSDNQGEMRAKIVNPNEQKNEQNSEWKGKSYALFFANDIFDDNSWQKLNNPQNDARDVARELTERYDFKETVIKQNLTTAEIYDTIENYQDVKFKDFNAKEDQLFIFFAGHGVADKYNKGFYVGRDSPSQLTRENEGKFVSLDGVLNAIDRIPVEHIMVVFDACYAGQVWKPSIQLIQENAFLNTGFNDSLIAELVLPAAHQSNVSEKFLNFAQNDSFGAAQISKLAYAKRKMKERSRRVLTSGDKPVPDGWRKADGTMSSNSPFADAFLRALQTNGGNFGVLITPEIVPFIDKLQDEPQIGKLSGSNGDFVFVRPDK